MNGTEAYLSGAPLEANPHPLGGRAWAEWMSDYLAAAFEGECV